MKKLIFILALLPACLLSCHKSATNSEQIKSNVEQSEKDVSLLPDWNMEIGTFKDSAQCIAANMAIHASKNYDAFMAVLLNYSPIPIPQSATPYQRYKMAKAQFDSICLFEPTGGTGILYLYCEFCQLFNSIASEHLQTELREMGLLTTEEDSAWAQYFRAMDLVIDSVVMCRPSGQGNISELEAYAFLYDLQKQQLKAFEEEYFATDSAYYHEQHPTITEQDFNSAYDYLYKHQRLWEGDEEFGEMTMYEVPVAERKKAIDADKKAWQNLLDVRVQIANNLPNKYRFAYQNATENMKRSKIIMLKNLYKEFRLLPDNDDGSYYLKRDCSDKELREYDFDKAINRR